MPSHYNAGPAVLVTAGIILDADKVLITLRREGDRLAGKWEFPGGKIEHHEKPTDCLIRKLKEKLDIKVKVTGLFNDFFCQYPWNKVHLYAFTAEIVTGKPKAIECQECRWVFIKDLPDYDFVPADCEIVNKLLKN